MKEKILKNRYLADSRNGLIKLISASYVCRGYHWWYHHKLRPNVDPERIDAKLHELYNLNLSKYQIARRKKQGLASVKYLRYERDYFLLLTKGRHTAWEDHKSQIKPFNHDPLRVFGYSVSLREGRVHTTIERDKMREYRAYFADMATKRSKSALEREINALPYDRYRGVVLALASLFELVNGKRRRAGLPLLETRYLSDMLKPCQCYASEHP